MGANVPRILAVLLIAATVAGCPPYDGPTAMKFNGRHYLGYMDAIRGPLPDAVREVGTASDLNAPVAGTAVFALGDLDPVRFVLMRAVPELASDYVLFIADAELQRAAATPFGAAFPELCPYLELPALRTGCPDTPAATPVG